MAQALRNTLQIIIEALGKLWSKLSDRDDAVSLRHSRDVEQFNDRPGRTETMTAVSLPDIFDVC